MSPLVAALFAAVASANDWPSSVFGIVGIVWIAGSFLAIVLGALSIKAGSRREATNKGLGVFGLTMGILSLSFLGIMFLVLG